MKVKINHSLGAYPVYILRENWSDYFKKEKIFTNRNAFIIIDSNVYKHYRTHLDKTFKKNFNVLNLYKFTANEKNKSFQELNKILSAMLKSQCDRNSLVISVGGGITGDISSFAASIFMRGVDYVHIPTTLLSMVDSSVGGKTGINFSSGKNLIGTFYQPKAVFVDVMFLSTLPIKEIKSGVGEIVKYSFLCGKSNRSLFNKSINNILRKDFSNIEKIIHKCIKIKSAVVESDEREVKGIRKILNLGHTFAHGIESASDYKINHGEAVFLGIISSLFYSYRAKLISAEYLFSRLISLKPNSVFLKKSVKYIYPEKVLLNMYKDKKNKNNKINLVLINNSCEVIIDYPARSTAIINSLDDMVVWLKESV